MTLRDTVRVGVIIKWVVVRFVSVPSGPFSLTSY